MARMAYEEYDASWVIHSDADEFWWPEAGNLRAALGRIPERYALVEAPRVNFRPVRRGAGAFHEEMLVRDTTSFNSLGDPLPPKVAHRGVPGVVIGDGNHEVLQPSLVAAPLPSPITILHFPLRTVGQLRSKVITGARALKANRELPPDYAIHWRTLYRGRRRGAIERYYESQVVPPELVHIGIESGELVEDRRLHDFLRTKARRSPPFGARGDDSPP
jgi:hypothetical protein